MGSNLTKEESHLLCRMIVKNDCHQRVRIMKMMVVSRIVNYNEEGDGRDVPVLFGPEL